MRNVKINEAESIFEAFWDSGESYPEHHKYTCLWQYNVETNNMGSVGTTWMSVSVKLKPVSDRKYPVVMQRSCRLDICGYDVFRLFAAVGEAAVVRVICTVDGNDVEVINDRGYNTSKEYNGRISGKLITNIRLEFENSADTPVNIELFWMGLSNAEKEKAMLAQKSPYDEHWEGCFAEKAEIKPQTGIYFNDKELAQLREKLEKPAFSDKMQLLRKEAEAAMDIVPEEYVGTYVYKQFRRFLRERDVGKPVLHEMMEKLAFVGIVDENMEMLKMACRIALSVAHCKYFCESIIGVFPGATWHHRSFTEESICKALVKVLDWAGGLLTWHGKNIIYDSIIMKGLPRIDADVKTMDYIWTMNQGPAFCSSLVIVLIALQKKYPRYAVRVDEAERDLLKMWELYVLEDGGSAEGPQYWDFTLNQMIEALYLLARYRGEELADYAPDSIKRGALYAEALLGDTDGTYIGVNDAHLHLTYSRWLTNFLAKINTGEIWKNMSNELLEKPAVPNEERLIQYLIFAERFETDGAAAAREFISMPVTGHTTLRRKTDDCGMVGFHAISGAVTFGHAHADKGSFVLEAGGKSLLIDRGVCGYDNPYASVICKSEVHNMLTAADGKEQLSQCCKNESYSAKVIKSEYNNGILEYETDLTAAWDGVFKKNIRKITSPSPYRYVIEDNAATDYTVYFNLNTYGEIAEKDGAVIITDTNMQLTIRCENWSPQRTEYGAYGVDGEGKTVRRLCMYPKKAASYGLVTSIELSKI